jgi:hypothetical protein
MLSGDGTDGAMTYRQIRERGWGAVCLQWVLSGLRAHAFSLTSLNDLMHPKLQYNKVRTHLSIGKDAPVPRAVEATGNVVALPIRS